jgi:hypothetical protein
MLMIFAVSTSGWLLLGAVYFALLVSIGLICIRKGHWVMFVVGIFVPLFWIVGAVMPPTQAATAATR